MPDIAEARLCITCGAAAPTFDRLVSNWAPGFTGAGGVGAAGSAVAVALNIRAETAPAAAIVADTSSFRVRIMILQFVVGEGLHPKLVSYWWYSSDTCGIYATVTGATAYGDRSLESIQ
ncbi:hypothetical protein MAGR_67760 [Mycolicibacterium agri]|uniref:Uncharacterized protein n=1 Tax=Mycolicibacterium agri TaxID=36811 RepID=A0A7I9WC81_MYCAG|nr:hypothetical protein MAGR_67760 [Mycolicibacterium agri]